MLLFGVFSEVKIDVNTEYLFYALSPLVVGR